MTDVRKVATDARKVWITVNDKTVRASHVDMNLDRHMQNKLLDGLYGSIESMSFTATIDDMAAQPSLDALMDEARKMVAEARRNAVTFVVESPHLGPIVAHQTPHDGTRFEMSWDQANELHKQCPMRLHKVLSPDMAEFVPITGMFRELVPSVLPMPPFDMPETDHE